MTDEELIQAVAARDKDAFTELDRRYRPDLIRSAYSKLGDYSAAEDVAQDVFKQVFRHAASFDSAKGSFAAWVCRIKQNAIKDALKYRVRRRTLPIFATLLAGRELSPELAYEYSEVRAAIDRLPEADKTLAMMVLLDDRSQRDAARELGLHFTTVHRRMRAIRARLAA